MASARGTMWKLVLAFTLLASAGCENSGEAVDPIGPHVSPGRFVVERVDGLSLPFVLDWGSGPTAGLRTFLMADTVELDGHGIVTHHLFRAYSGLKNREPYYEELRGSVTGSYRTTGKCSLVITDPFWGEADGIFTSTSLRLQTPITASQPARQWILRRVSGGGVC